MTGSIFRRSPGKREGTEGEEPVPPVIILGMHRSGTSLITALLEACGMFSGFRKDPNHESFFFIGLNDWLLSQAGCRWDTPEAFSYALQDTALRDKMVEQLSHMMRAPGAEAYLGKSPGKSGGGIGELNRHWGWKDPRNTITLPLWLEVFPDARVICVERHGVDVAVSLRARSAGELAKWRVHDEVKGPILMTDSARCLSLEGAFTLWQHYMATAMSHRKRLADRMLNVRFEDLMARPEAELDRVREFCGIACGDSVPNAFARKVNPGRAYAYRSDPALVSFAAQHQDDLQSFGYAHA